MQTTESPSIALRASAAAMLFLFGQAAGAGENDWMSLGADNNFAAWHQSGDWYTAGNATLDPDNGRRLVGEPGTGVMINGQIGKTPSLVTKQTFEIGIAQARRAWLTKEQVLNTRTWPQLRRLRKKR